MRTLNDCFSMLSLQVRWSPPSLAIINNKNKDQYHCEPHNWLTITRALLLGDDILSIRYSLSHRDSILVLNSSDSPVH